MSKIQLKRNEKIILSIVLATSMILLSFAGLEMYSSNQYAKVISLGPKVNVALPQNISSAGSSNVTESIQIFSVNPSCVKSQSTSMIALHSSQKQGYIDLFNATIFPKNVQKSFSGFMSFKGFSTILKGWQTYYEKEGYSLGDKGQEVSLEIEATLSLVRNGNLSVYPYYNNIPFNPLSCSFKVENTAISSFKQISSPYQWLNNTGINPPSNSVLSYIPYYFNLTPSFNLGKPMYVAKKMPQGRITMKM